MGYLTAHKGIVIIEVGRWAVRSKGNHVCNFSPIILEHTKVEYGGSNFLDMCILDLLMSWSVLTFMDLFLAATKQLYEWYILSVCLSVCPSVCLSVCHTFLTMFPSSYHHEIFRSYHQGPG